MMKKLMIFILIAGLGISANAQKMFTKNGEISFYSKAPMEEIEAHNSKATAVMDAANGAIEWAVLIKAFQFEKALMQEHFNENYMESSTYPKAMFKGHIDEIESIDLSSDGSYESTASGTLSIHGEDREITVPVTFKVADGNVVGTSEFKVLVADYGIEIPAVVRENIAKEVKIVVKANLEELK